MLLTLTETHTHSLPPPHPVVSLSLGRSVTPPAALGSSTALALLHASSVGNMLCAHPRAHPEPCSRAFLPLSLPLKPILTIAFAFALPLTLSPHPVGSLSLARSVTPPSAFGSRAALALVHASSVANMLCAHPRAHPERCSRAFLPLSLTLKPTLPLAFALPLPPHPVVSLSLGRVVTPPPAFGSRAALALSHASKVANMLRDVHCLVGC